MTLFTTTYLQKPVVPARGFHVLGKRRNQAFGMYADECYINTFHPNGFPLVYFFREGNDSFSYPHYILVDHNVYL